MITDPCAVAAVVLWAGVVLLVAVLLGRGKARKNRRLFDPTPMPGEVTHLPVIVTGTPGLRNILADPTVAPATKAALMQAAHDAGTCGCELFDQQHAAVADEAAAWPRTQGRGA